MAARPPLTDEDRAALEQMRDYLRRYPGQYGRMDDKNTQRYAQELLLYPPHIAYQKAHEFRNYVKAVNDKEAANSAKAAERLQQLKAQPVYSLGYTGLLAVFLRSFMASLNGTPLSAPNWYILNETGLRFYTPFAIVTERVVTARELQDKRFELGVNPPVYFDAILGFLKQMRMKAQAPWGQITLREPGSGVTLAEVVEFWPEARLAQIRKDLEAIQRANDPFGKHVILPKLGDFYNYYLDEWDDTLLHSAAPRTPPPVAPPTITSSPITTTLRDQAYTYGVIAAGSPPLSFFLVTGLAGMSINANTGLLSWTPSTTGNFPVTVRASNEGGSIVQTFTVTVAELPKITSTAVTDAFVDQPYAYDVDATGLPAPTFSLVQAPAGMTINATSGLINWTPQAAGIFSVSVAATNPHGVANQDFAVSVTD